jgi:hypothetical protein
MPFPPQGNTRGRHYKEQAVKALNLREAIPLCEQNRYRKIIVSCAANYVNTLHTLKWKMVSLEGYMVTSVL